MTTVRRATITDLDAVAQIHVRTWQIAFAGYIPAAILDALNVEDRKTMWAKALDSASWNGEIFVAENDSEVVGFASVGVDAGHAIVSTLYVEADQWSSGFGSLLLSAAESEIANRGFERGYLWTLKARPQSRGFYEAKGWEATGNERHETLHGATIDEVEYGKRLQ